MIRHFEALWDCDKHIRKYGTSLADSVDFNRNVVGPELASLQCLFTIATSRPPSLFVLICFPLLQYSTALTLPSLARCWRPDVELLPFGGDGKLFDVSTFRAVFL